ncbi:hypothetical protein ACIQ7Q_24905 [Streptomyces sp. NPDC096176]|uniref:hypothetical protein n=1 Tax=Streptomyces sp. NPDC096176 TaxID=3366079 RepID=UPI00381B5357
MPLLAMVNAGTTAVAQETITRSADVRVEGTSNVCLTYAGFERCVPHDGQVEGTMTVSVTAPSRPSVNVSERQCPQGQKGRQLAVNGEVPAGAAITLQFSGSVNGAPLNHTIVVLRGTQVNNAVASVCTSK